MTTEQQQQQQQQPDADILASLQRRYAESPDPRDARTDRERDERATYRHRLQHLSGSFGGKCAELQHLEEKRAPFVAGLERNRDAETRLLSLLTDQPNDPQITAALDKLRRDSSNALPKPLRELMTDRCDSCGHEEINWPGSIDYLEYEVSRRDEQIADIQRQLGVLRRAATELLARESEPVTA